MTEHLVGGARAQNVGVVDAVATTTMECTKVMTLRPGRAAPGRWPRFTISSANASMRRLRARIEVNANPALATAWSSSNITSRRAGLCEAGIEKVPSGLGVMAGLATAILPGRRAFLVDGQAFSASADRWIEA